MDKAEEAVATRFIDEHPSQAAEVVSLLQTEDPKYPFVSHNAALGALQVRYCWACQRDYEDYQGSSGGVRCGRMMAQKRVEKHVSTTAHNHGSIPPYLNRRRPGNSLNRGQMYSTVGT